MTDPITLLSAYVEREQDPDRLRECFASAWVIIDALTIRLDGAGARQHKRELVELVFDEELERQRAHLLRQEQADDIIARFAEFRALVIGAA
jgi:hypothetical protein